MEEKTPIPLDPQRLANIGYWVNGGDTGLSSMFLLAVILGAKPGAANTHYPADPADLNRCMELIMSLNDFDAEDQDVGQLDYQDELAILRAAGQLSPHWTKLHHNYKQVRELWADGDARKRTLYGLMQDLYAEVKAEAEANEK